MFWFQPRVRWLERHLVEEREQACDEMVLTRGGNREAYASSLVGESRWYAEMPTASAVGVTGGRLRRRVAAILRGQPGEGLRGPRKALLWGLATMVFAGPLAAGLLFGQAATPAFAAVSIRINRDAGPLMIPRTPFRTDPAGIHGAACTLQDLIAFAYGIDDDRIIGGDAWVRRQPFRVDATTEVPASNKQLRMMMQKVLSDRFGLRLQRESKRTPVLQLVLAKGGPRLRKLAPGTAPKPTSIRPGGIAYHFPSIRYLLQIVNSPREGVRQVLGRPVVDDTGLTGRYDIDPTVGFTPVQFEGRERNRIDWTTLPSALKAIGLELKPGMANYVTYVIQSAHLPTPN